MLIDPWNEFDGICKAEIGSPAKAARYHGIMQVIFDRAGLRNEVLMPSIVNVYKGSMSRVNCGRYDKMRVYMNDYYASGGSGRPTSTSIWIHNGQATQALSRQSLKAN